ncbi:hypothetical protein HBI14_137000 [Parastagonospora nodorum]|nr:hypothetical protein HBI14_137000 [Parastagonospora nodorum]
MCYQVVERYSVCRCLYHQHSIDPCSVYGQRGHAVQEKTVLVGYACSMHSSHRPEVTYNAAKEFGSFYIYGPRFEDQINNVSMVATRGRSTFESITGFTVVC